MMRLITRTIDGRSRPAPSSTEGAAAIGTAAVRTRVTESVAAKRRIDFVMSDSSLLMSCECLGGRRLRWWRRGRLRDRSGRRFECGHAADDALEGTLDDP